MPKIKTIMSDPRYLELLTIFQPDWISFAALIANKKPTW
jgi:hypothetical protein